MTGKPKSDDVARVSSFLTTISVAAGKSTSSVPNLQTWSNVAGRWNVAGSLLGIRIAGSIVFVLLGQALRSVLCQEAPPNLRDRPNELDCEQRHSCDRGAHRAKSDHENSTLGTSSPPKESAQLMPAVVHFVSTPKSETPGSAQ